MTVNGTNSAILVEVQHGVTFITLNRPEKMNSISKALATALLEALDDCKDPAIRCVCITGSGNAFCAGQDLAEGLNPGAKGMDRLLAELYNPIVKAINDLEKPVIAAVNGAAAGAGANLALCCDLLVAADSAYFLQAFTRIGLMPDTGGTWFLPRTVGLQKALSLTLLAEKLSSTDAWKLGMVYKVVPREELNSTVETLAMQLATQPTRALWLTKKALRQSFANDLDQQLALEDTLQKEALASTDAKEGVKAFMEKRKPVFTGQ
jgi:2-(1,2-epoxy-1,2-dihydrophenyl)acetyl-CoA isomerase